MPAPQLYYDWTPCPHHRKILLPLCRWTSAGTLVPHLDALDCHAPGSSLTPRLRPLCRGIPKFLGGSVGGISPRLVANTILEEAVGCSDRYIENEVEIFIEWRAGPTCLRPRVEKSRIVDGGLAKSSTRPHVIVFLVEFDKENLL